MRASTRRTQRNPLRSRHQLLALPRPMMNTAQRTLLADEIARSHSYGWTVIEAAVVPATRNLLGAHRDVAVLVCDTGDDSHGRYHIALMAADMFAGSRSRIDTLDGALNQYRAHTGDYAATQPALF